ncbi:MAG: AEC family transporter [Lachnotalea sp.]
MNYIGIIDTMFKLFALMLLGYYLNRKDYLNSDTNSRLSDLVVKFTAPALIISSVFMKQSSDKGDVIKIIVIGLIIYFILPILAFLITKLLRVSKSKEGVYQMLIMFSNVSFMSYPIVQSLYGDTAIFYNTLLHMPFNILIFTYGEYLLMEGNTKIKIKTSDILSPGVIAAVIAIVIYFTGIQIPSFLSTSFSFLGGITTPLSMLILGSVLGGYPIKDLFTEKKIYVVSFIKLIILPVLVFFITSMIFTDPIIIGVATLSMGMPAASMCVMLSIKYEGQIKTASVGVFLTTMLSLITIPIIYILLL